MNKEICEIVLRHRDEKTYSETVSEGGHCQICSLITPAYHLANERDGRYLFDHPGFPDRQKCLEILGVLDDRLTDFRSTTPQSAVTK